MPKQILTQFDSDCSRAVRDLMFDHFKVEVIGYASFQSQFNQKYTSFYFGRAVEEGAGISPWVAPEIVIKNTKAWLKSLPRDHTVLVWRMLPEEEIGNVEGKKRWKIYWRCHTMTLSDLLNHVNGKARKAA